VGNPLSAGIGDPLLDQIAFSWFDRVMVEGACVPRFAAVREEFERNFSERNEVGASVCVTLDGETVVDLWGGISDPGTGAAWDKHTVGIVWSCTKGATAVCAHVLVARGELDLDASVATYWAEFAKNGKQDVTVRHVLAHQAGLAALRDPIPDGGYCNWDLIADVLAAQEPLWEPGTRHGYHALTFGHLVGEIVRRITGRSLGSFFHDEIASPLGLDFHIGLPPEHEARVAPTIPAPMPGPGDVLPSFYTAALSDPSSIAGMVLFNSGAVFAPGFIDTREAHAAEMPSINGVTNARGLAGMYRPLALGGAVDGVRLVDPATLHQLGAVVSASSIDATMLVPTRFALGFVKSVDNRQGAPLPPSRLGDQDGVVLSEDAFGHVGMGGSIGFADPRARVSFAYTMNRQGMTVGLDDRGQSLVDAVYRVLGYQRASRGSWFI
jgi:CubicO group peptidase (beta-lactamase class C family)